MTLSISETEQNQMFIRFSGKLKTYEDFLEFREKMQPAITELAKKTDKTLFLFFVDVYPINSYTIGYLLKLKENDSIDVKIATNDVKLLQLFKTLELIDKFEVCIKSE
ncbi:hypothetical protein BJI48_01350 [Helicobacter sp. 11S02596-1]|nr:hypothetical protein BJI48_01350 [Helicobacter sp. 11S02596-1]